MTTTYRMLLLLALACLSACETTMPERALSVAQSGSPGSIDPIDSPLARDSGGQVVSSDTPSPLRLASDPRDFRSSEVASITESDPIEAYFKLNPKRAMHMKSVTFHRVVVGMNGAEVRLSIGGPTRVNRWNGREQWVYKETSAYVFLKGNVVTSVEGLD
jgi:outer membrane protein assembly factor BamE (lipoprotein component of BamABCDE complex)